MMKNSMKNLIRILFAAFIIIAVSSAVNVKAAIKPKVRETSVTLYTDADPYTIYFTNLLADSKVSYSTSDKSVIKIKDSKAVPVKAGKATVTISIDQHGKTYTLKVKFKVKEAPKAKTYTEADYKKLAKKQNDNMKKTAKKLNYKCCRNDELIKTTEQLDEILNKYTKIYISFGLYITNFNILRSVEEYRNMFPYLTTFEMNQPVIYQDAMYIYIECEIASEERLKKDENALLKAIKIKDTSYLSEDGKKYYDEIITLADSLKGESDFETLKNILDHISLNVDYEHDETVEERYNLTYALDHGMAVCSGYAKLFYFLCTVNEINCKLIRGKSVQSVEDKTDTTHLWNLVELNHKWYHIDATWDDCYEYDKGYTKAPYRYFLIDDEQMKKDHIWEEADYPKAYSKDLAIYYSYLEKYPMVTGKKETLRFIKEMAIALSDSDDTEFLLEFNETSYSNETYYAVYRYLGKLKKEFGISYKDFTYESQKNKLGRIYRVTLYKK